MHVASFHSGVFITGKLVASPFTPLKVEGYMRRPLWMFSPQQSNREAGIVVASRNT
jgi:hypothetical protein